MDYLQYLIEFKRDLVQKDVLNLIINGLPSISLDKFRIRDDD